MKAIRVSNDVGYGCSGFAHVKIETGTAELRTTHGLPMLRKEYLFACDNNPDDFSDQSYYFQLSGQLDNENPEPYAVRYAVFHNHGDGIQLRSVDFIAKHARAFNRKLAKMDKTMGYAKTFDEHAVRFYLAYKPEMYFLPPEWHWGDMDAFRSAVRSALLEANEHLAGSADLYARK